MPRPIPTSPLDELAEVPTELRARLERLSPDKRALALKRWSSLSAGRGPSVPDEALVHVNREGDLPLSVAQERLWILHEMDREDPSYNIPAALVLKGNLRVEVLKDALKQIVNRHEALHTVFTDLGDGPIQRVVANPSFHLPLVDLTHLPELEREEETHREARREIEDPFDLRQGPLIRGRLIQTHQKRHVLLLTVHHIVADGWSMGIIVKEVEALYRSRITGTPPSLEPLPVQYSDVAVWQRGLIRKGGLEQDIQFWKHQMKDAPTVLDLPSDRARPPVRSSKGGTERFHIDGALSQKLSAIAQESGATSNMVLLTAFGLFLSRISEQDDIIIGSPLAGRTRKEMEPLVGFFVNTLPVRCRLEGNPTFLELLARTRKAVADTIEHQNLPFERLVEELQPARNPSHTPIFQVVFGYQESPPKALELPDLQVSPLGLDGSTAKHDLTLLIEAVRDSFTGILEYNSGLFSASTARRYIECFLQILHSVASSPRTALDDIALLSEVEEAAILRSWCGETRPYPRDRSIQSVFEEMVDKHPDNCAVVAEGTSVSYRDLNSRANHIAHSLIAKGVSPGASVGICLERSVDLIAGIIGILKAGATYIPLDPAYPDDRLGFLVTDADILIALVDHSTASRITQASPTCDRLDLDSLPDSGIQQLKANPNVVAQTDGAAYVMYTSGSTGLPKGAAIPHRAVLRLVLTPDFVTISEDDVFLQFAPVSFDASTFEIWGPLLNGGRLVLAPPGGLGLDELGEVIRRHSVTTLWLTSGLFNLMVDEHLDDLRNVRQLLAGGDVLSVPHVEKALKALPDTQLINGYGPTENTTFTCCHSIEPGDLGARSIPIGRPIANTTVYIVDQNLRPVPPGVPGELLTGGDGLFLGYVNRPDLNRECLIPNPFSDQQGSRLYRTGDLARFLEDGCIEFVGRVDEQVKIRGFRIEPGEIESVLIKHPDVRESAVVVQPGPSEHRSLAAYVVGDLSNGRSLPTDEDLISSVIAHVDKALPAHLVPSTVTVMEALPLGPNGKVDKASLPLPKRPSTQGSSGTPTTRTEIELAALWKEILDIDPSVDESFFELGGNSLLATQVVSRIRKRQLGEIAIHDLFRFPTIRELGSQLDRRVSPDPTESGIPRLSENDDGSSPSFAQERLWFLDRLEPGNPFYNVAFAHRIVGPLDVTALEQSLTAVLKRHDVLRMSFAEADGQPRLEIQDDLAIRIPVEDIRNAEDLDGEIARQAQLEARQTFDLTSAPLLRTRVLITSQNEHVILLTMHHIVSDGWSLGVLVQEIAANYAHLTKGEALQPQELPIQYADFSNWQKKWLESDHARDQLDYWRGQLADYPPELVLPADRPRPPVQSFKGGSINFKVDAQTTAQLGDLCKRHDATMYMVLLSVFSLLLHRYSEQEDILVGSPIANRNHDELEPLIGFFVNTLALRTDLSGSPSFSELIGRVRKASLEAFDNQDYPFEKVVDELQPERDLSRNPLFQVMFALQNAPEEELTIDELSFASLDLERTAAQFDIVLDMWEREDGLLGVFEYSTDLFDRTTIDRMVGHFQTLLRSVVEDETRQLADLPLLEETEREQLLTGFAGPVRSYPVDRTIHDLFEQMVEAHPGRIAVTHEGQSVTYDALNTRANRIAHELRGNGLKPNQFAAILEPRGIDFLASILGVLKAGGAYLPVDVQYPEDRIRHMLQDSGVSHLITRSEILEEHSAALAKEQVDHVLTLDGPDLDQRPSSNPDHLNTSRDLAYLLYTSGSTGQPKGAMVRHDGAINHIFAEFDLLGFHLDTAFLQSAPASADISVWQFLGPVLKGARTVIADFETVCDPIELFGLIKSEGVTLIELVPVVMQGLLEYARELDQRNRSLPALENAMVTGEAVSVPLVNLWIDTYPDVPLVNAYGPTEAADDTCQYVISEKLLEDRRSVPIGESIPNMHHYIVDSQMNLQPIGVPGEICVTGIGVGTGYWGDDEKTRDSFVLNPFTRDSADPNQHVLYRTGDRGFWRPDGNLECLERMDTQVKVRGFRIELGEIESVLGQHPVVREAAVIVREDEPGDRRLAAYLVSDSSSPETHEDLIALQEEQIDLWKDLHENSYRNTQVSAPTFNTIGWDSNYTNEPLPEAEMREYVEHTCERIRSLGPGRVLEIGCGTGLIMFPLLPHTTAYTGTDLSAVAIDQLKAYQVDPALQSQIKGLRGATLERRPAHDLTGFAPAAFDTVIFPSVVQYFPGVEYLEQTLESILDTVAPGGRIFIGDVRSLGLLETFHASVQLYKADNKDTTSDILARTRQRVESEQEMAIEPGFFTALSDRYDRIGRVEILPKRGRGLNEMTCFRYDVIVHLDQTPAVVPDVKWQNWEQYRYSIEQIKKHIQDNTSPIAISGIRNARVERESRALSLMRSYRAYANKASLESEVNRHPVAGLDPEDIWDIQQALPCRVQLSAARSGQDGRIDALFVRTDTQGSMSNYAMPELAENRTSVHYANNPLQEQLGTRIVPKVRKHLRDKVPAYMVPSDFVLLSRMPQTPAGKIDRDALPRPDLPSEPQSGSGRPATTPTERELAEIWTQVLGIPVTDVGANFFELGGHSLKATQVVSRINRSLGLDIPLRELFSLPTIEELAARLDGMESGMQNPISPTIPADDYPLSHGQRRLWILSQIEETSSAYNMPASLLLNGPFDTKSFTDALQALVDRHESLRTKFVVVNDEPRQIIDSHADIGVEEVDLTEEAAPESRAQEIAKEHASRAFDLANGPLIRVSVLKLDDRRHVLLFNVHHIVADEWSMGLLVQEITTLYEAILEGRTVELGDLPIQYKDYAAWQHEALQSTASEEERAFWLTQFSTLPPVLELPTDGHRPPVKTFRGSSVSHTLDADTSGRLVSFSKENEASLFMTLVTAVNVLLLRYSEQDDFTIGLPVAGRSNADLEGLIGFFINTLPFRAQIDPTSTLKDLLAHTRDQMTECLDHQMYPSDRLIDELDLRRDVSRTPLYDVTVTLQNVDPYTFSLPGVSVSPFVEDYDMSKFDLSFNFQETGSGLRMDISYNSDLFLRERIERMTGHFEQLMKNLLDDAAAEVSRVNILPPAELQLVCPRVGPVEAPDDISIVDWFERQAAQTPDNVAIVQGLYGDRHSLTYDELNRQANQLVHHLHARGVRDGDRVGLFLDRSTSVIVSILAILKARGAYVPLDPIYPADRIAFVIDDAQVTHVVTQAGLSEQLRLGDKVEIVDVTGEATSIMEQPTGNPEQQAGPHDPAYVIYTSGSTGQPKGVIVTHRNVTRLFRTTEDHFGFNDTDTWTLFHSYSFDFSVWEIWGALLYGGRLVVVSQQLSRTPADFLDLLAREQVTVLNQTPSAFQQLIGADSDANRDLSLRYVIFGGEALDYECLRPWIDRRGDAHPRLVNMYGITETTVHVTHREVSADDINQSRSLIGQPLPDLRVYILDRFANPCPVGVPGEICVAGEGVARCYLGRPELTEEKFVADPYKTDGRSRMYRSGDLAQRSADGEIEYCGRQDSQVQIRGFRVELGEIETRLAAHPAIRESAVVADQHGGDTRILSYCVLSQEVETAALRSFLNLSLPEYMIPSRFVFLDTLPLTENGKLDRRSLPDPGDTPSDSVTFTAPENDTEAVIAAAFADELGLDQVSRDANFFDLGAHSMGIVRVHQGLEQQHGMNVSIVSFYTYPTVAALAAHVTGANEPSQLEHQEAVDRGDLRRRARSHRRSRARGRNDE